MFYLFCEKKRSFLSLEKQVETPNFYGTSSGKETNSKPSDSGENVPSCYSPLEDVQKFHHWGGFFISLAAIYISNQAVLNVLRRLKFTEGWVKGMVDKGWPKWCFFWLKYDKPKQLNEKGLFHLMVCILILNLVILYIIVRVL